MSSSVRMIEAAGAIGINSTGVTGVSTPALQASAAEMALFALSKTVVNAPNGRHRLRNWWRAGDGFWRASWRDRIRGRTLRRVYTTFPDVPIRLPTGAPGGIPTMKAPPDIAPGVLASLTSGANPGNFGFWNAAEAWSVAVIAKAGTVNGAIVANTDYDGTWVNYRTDGRVAFAFQETNLLLSTPDAAPVGSYHLIVICWDAASTTLRLYINGALNITATAISATPQGSRLSIFGAFESGVGTRLPAYGAEILDLMWFDVDLHTDDDDDARVALDAYAAERIAA